MHTKSAKPALIGLVLLFAGVYFLPLNIRPLGIPDEMRYGEIAREMLAAGDLVVPRLNGLRYFEKPAGGHLLNAAAMAAFGENNFSVRLMSALATGLAALALFGLMKRGYPRQTAALGAFIFLTCTEVMAIGTYSVLDSMVSGFITLAICCFYPALGASGARRAGWLALAGVFAGGAFMVKGFIAFAVPVVVIVPFLMVQRRWKDLAILPWIPIAVAVAVALPWSLAIAAREPDFWRYFFWEEHVRRFFSHGEAQHAAPFWYFVPVFLGGTIPWIFIAPVPLRDLFRRRLGEPLVRFALVWMAAPFLFFSASSGKLGTYILPCFPPFALLLAVALTDQPEQGTRPRPVQIGLLIFGTIILAALAFVVVACGMNALERLPEMDTRLGLKLCCMLAGLGLALGLAILGFRNKDSLRKSVHLGLAAATVFVAATTCAPTDISTSMGLQNFLESERSHIGPDTLVIGNQKTVHALCYVYKRDDVYLFRGKGELSYGLSYPDSEHRYLEPPELQQLLSQRGDRPVAVAIKSSPGDAIRAQFPLPAYQRQWKQIWFAVYEPLTPTTRKD